MICACGAGELSLPEGFALDFKNFQLRLCTADLSREVGETSHCGLTSVSRLPHRQHGTLSRPISQAQ
jgi:hypothetical protein